MLRVTMHRVESSVGLGASSPGPVSNGARRRLGCASLLGLLLWWVSGGSGTAATFSVVNANDSGAGSLRQALLDANDWPGEDGIIFAIPGTGVHTIGLQAG